MAYDLAGKRTNLLVTTPNNSITSRTGYDGLDRLSNIVFSAFKTISATYAYNPNGKIALMNARKSVPGQFPSNSLAWSYDSENRLAAITGSFNGAKVADFAYSYNDAQQITKMTETVISSTLTHNYSYDDRDQLVGEEIPEITSGYDVTYSYDHAQNRLTKQNGALSPDDFSYEIANKMTNIHIGVASANNRYWYDLAGNLTSNMQNGTITRHFYNAQTTSALDSARGERVKVPG